METQMKMQIFLDIADKKGETWLNKSTNYVMDSTYPTKEPAFGQINPLVRELFFDRSPFLTHWLNLSFIFLKYLH